MDIQTETALPDTWVCLVTAAGENPAQDAPAVLAAAAAALRDPDARVAVVYRAPTDAVAGRLQAGADVAAALAGWAEECAALLDLQRANRRRLALIAAPSGGAPADAARGALAEATGADWPKLAWSPPEAAFGPVAALALHGQRRTREMADRLQAASRGGLADLPPGPALLEQALATVRAGIAERQDAAARLAARDTALGEARLCEAAALRQVVDLEAALRRSETTGQEATAALQVRLDEAERLTALMAGQVVDLEAALRRSEASAQAAAAGQQERLDEAEALKARFAAQAGELSTQAGDLKEALRQSRARAAGLSARLEDQAEMLRRAETQRQADLDEREAEARAGAVLQQQVGALQEALLQTEAERAEITGEKLRLDAVYRRQVAAVSGLLDSLHGSTSWRLTRPVRAFRRYIRN